MTRHRAFEEELAKVSKLEQACRGGHRYDRLVVVRGASTLIMKTQCTCLSAFTCIECNGQLVAAFVETGEAEGRREIIKRQLGLGCLSCGTQYDPFVPSRAIRHIVPLAWGSADLANERATAIPVAA
jgi:hypothetical protein